MTRSWLFPAALLAMMAGPAFAADMPLKAPPPVVPVAAGWNGTYVGVQVGERWNHDDWQTTCIQGGGVGALAALCGNANNAVVFPGAPDGSAFNAFSSSGTRYGIYMGWMFQAYDRWVFGAESDYAWGSKTQTVAGILGCATAACTGGLNGPGPFTGDSTTLKVQDDFAFRVRAGFLVLPELQLYVAGGPAAERVSATVVCTTTGANACFPGLVSTSTSTRVGYTVGGGLEWKVWDHLLLRGEYRYNDYGTWKQTAFLQSGQIEEFANVRIKSQMVNFGIAWLIPPPRW